MSDASSKEHSDEELGLAVNLWTSDRSGPFAQEIYDIIIDFVEQLEYGHPQLRRETLWACTLTCKRFVERSRKHLFHFLRLSPTTNVRRYEAVYCPSRLGLYVRSIRLEDAMAWAGNTDDGSPEESIDSIRNWLTPFIPLLSRLRNVDLSLSAIRWAQLGPDSRTFILNTFGPTAKSLTMISSHLFTTNQTLKVLRSFPRLSKLFLWGPLWEYPNHTSGQLSAQGPLDLDSLTLFDDLDGRGKYISWLSPIFQWLLADRPLFRVREAAIHTASTAAPLLLALLQRMLPSLEKLQLVLDICGQRRCNWVEEPTYYELDDDELSNGEEIVEAGGDFQYREQRRHQLEYECDHWISDEEAWLHYARTFKPTGDLQAPKLKFADISVTVSWQAAMVIALLDWVASIAAPDMELFFQVNIDYRGDDLEDMVELGECIAHHLGTWRKRSSAITLEISWPFEREDLSEGGEQWLDFTRRRWSLLERLGMPFQGGSSTVKLPQADLADGPLQWSSGD